LKTAYLGTSEFAATVLRRLADSAHRPALVVTPSDSRKGRGRHLAPPPAAEVARELGLDLHQTPDVNSPESLQAIRAVQPRAIAVCAFGQLIREPLLSEFLMLNVHPSLIPRWRGAAPIERALVAGDEKTGVTIMSVTAGLDSGPVALVQEVPIAPQDDFETLAARLADVSGELLVRALDELEAGGLDFSEQDDVEATYAEKISSEERRLAPSRPAAELERIVRGLTPHIGAYLEFEGGERLGVRKARAVEKGPPEGAVEVRGDELVVGSSDGGLRLDVVQPPGKKPMSAAEFLRGHAPPENAV
jgi:methionyl-tRNA formyltransferase